MMHVIYNFASTPTDVTCEILAFLKANYLKHQVTAKLSNQVISKDFEVSN